MGIVGLLLLGFIYSFSQNTSHTAIPIEVNFPQEDIPRRLAADVYNENPIQNVKVYLDFYSLIKSKSKIDRINISSKEININQLKEIIIKKRNQGEKSSKPDR